MKFRCTSAPGDVTVGCGYLFSKPHFWPHPDTPIRLKFFNQRQQNPASVEKEKFQFPQFTPQCCKAIYYNRLNYGFEILACWSAIKQKRCRLAFRLWCVLPKKKGLWIILVTLRFCFVYFVCLFACFFNILLMILTKQTQFYSRSRQTCQRWISQKLSS